MQSIPRIARGGRGSFVTLFVALFVLWVIFVGSLDPQELLAGAVVAALVAALSGGLVRSATSKILSPVRILRVLAYVGVLAIEIVKANLDMARIVSARRIAIRPGIVKVRTRLTSPIARLVLANSITLTPGTLSVDIAGEDLFVHWVNVEAEDMEAATHAIVDAFEKHLEVIFG